MFRHWFASQALSRMHRAARQAARPRLQLVTLEGRDAPAATPVGAEFLVNATATTGNQAAPAVASDANGNFVVAWESPDGSDSGVYAQRYNAAGTAQGARFLVNVGVTAQNQIDAAVAMDADGDFVIAWVDVSYAGVDGDDTFGIFAQRYNAAGTAQGGRIHVNTSVAGIQRRPTVAMDDSGDFVVAWLDAFQEGNGNYGIYAQRFNAAGTPQGAEFQVTTVTTGTQDFPSAAMDADGDFVIAWISPDGDPSPGGDFGVFARRFNAAGTPQAAQFRVNTTTVNRQLAPSVGMSDAGAFVVAWESDGASDGDGYGIFFQRYNAAGTAQGGESPANTFTPGFQQAPSVSLDADGDFVIAWQSGNFESYNSDFGITARQFTAAGVPQQASEFLVNTNTVATRAQTAASVAADADGDFIVVWQSEAQDGNLDGIYGRLFDEPSDTNRAPTDIALSNNKLAENAAANTVVGTLSALDPDAGNTFTFTLVGGAGSTDNAAFNINGTQLRANAPFNFEIRNSYSVRVRVTDQGGMSFEEPFTVNITNVNEAPIDITLDDNLIAENAGANAVVGTLDAVDPDIGDTHTFVFVAGTGDADNALFNINGDQLRANSSLDFETRNTYSVRVRATDAGGKAFGRALTILVTDVNEGGNVAPTDIALSNATVPENAGANAVVGTLSAIDPDAGNTFTFTLVGGAGSADNAAFNLNGTQLRANASFNFEARSKYSVRVRVTDQGGLTYEEALAITVTNVNEAPTSLTLSQASILENAGANAVVGTLAALDPDAGGSHTFSLIQGPLYPDNALFNISGNQLRATGSFDFESRSSYTVRIRATDQGGLFNGQTFTITVTNVNEPPVGVALFGSTIQENAGGNALVGYLAAADPEEGTIAFSLVAGQANNNLFTIIGNQLRAAASFDFETKSSYSVVVRATDTGGQFRDQMFTINVVDVVGA